MDNAKCCGRHIKELTKPWMPQPICSECENCKRCCWTKDSIKCPTKDVKKRYEKGKTKKNEKVEKKSKFAFLA